MELLNHLMMGGASMGGRGSMGGTFPRGFSQDSDESASPDVSPKKSGGKKKKKRGGKKKNRKKKSGKGSDGSTRPEGESSKTEETERGDRVVGRAGAPERKTEQTYATGDFVLVHGEYDGVVRFVGTTHYAKGTPMLEMLETQI